MNPRPTITSVRLTCSNISSQHAALGQLSVGEQTVLDIGSCPKALKLEAYCQLQ